MACNSACALTLASLLIVAVTAQRTEWCAGSHEDEDGSLPHAEDFLMELFNLYGENASCTIKHEGYDKLIEALGIGNAGTESHDDHKRKKRSVDHTCYDKDDLLTVYNISDEDGITESQFTTLSPSLIQQVVQGCKHSETHAEAKPEAWGYGLLSVTVVSATALLGLIIARWRHTSWYKYLISVMLGLAVGTLVGDSLMHLIPHALGLHNHDDGHSSDAHEGVEEYVWKTLLACITAYLFFNLQALIQFFGFGHSHAHPNGQVSPVRNAGNNQLNEVKSDAGDNISTISAGNEKTEKESSEKVLAPESVGWMIALGDGLHNFADGLAIGAAYAESWQTGLGTTIAIFCHELPHEFGDVAALLSVGWSWKKVLIIQLVSQSTAYLGLFIGIPVAENTAARYWIFIMIVGMFLYIALSDLVPELLEYFKTYTFWKVFLGANLGILAGYVIMLLIAIFEERIHF